MKCIHYIIAVLLILTMLLLGFLIIKLAAPPVDCTALLCAEPASYCNFARPLTFEEFTLVGLQTILKLRGAVTGVVVYC